MYSRRDMEMKIITSKINLFFQNNTTDAKRNLNNGAVSCEIFLMNLFNIVQWPKDGTYEDTNVKKSNFEDIDLYNQKHKLGIQVTVQRTNEKIKSTCNGACDIGQNKLFNKIYFVIQVDSIPQNLKNLMSNNSKNINGYEFEIYSSSEILNSIANLEETTFQEALEYVNSSLVFPEMENQSYDYDTKIFQILFKGLLNRAQDEEYKEQNIEEYEFGDDIDLKKEIYSDKLLKIQEIYEESLKSSQDENSLARYFSYNKILKEVFSEELDEVEKNDIQKYLRLESLFILDACDEDILKSIISLSEKIKKDLNLSFVPKDNMIMFVINMFYKCDVFPVRFEKDEN